MAVGLLGYYFATDVLTGFEQSSLKEQFRTPAALAASPETTDTAFDWDGWEEDRAYFEDLAVGKPMGRLMAKRMGLDAVVVKGTTRSALMKGPGWITWSELPGPKGNFGVAGHRTTYGAPFRNIDRMRVGDTITFLSPFREYTYRVVKVFPVPPSRGEVMGPTKVPSLTMSACHPPYSARLRLICRSELVSVSKIAVKTTP